MRTFIITALAVALVLPAGALAGQADDAIRLQAPHSSLAVQPAPSGPDLRAPDQQAPASVASRLFTRGTDVAAPDQQAPIAPAAVEPVTRPVAPDGFDWGDAGLGAVAVLMLVVGAGVLAAHRRRGAHRIAPVS